MVKQRYYGRVASLLGVWAGSPSRMSVQHKDQSEFRSCVKAEVAVLSSPSLYNSPYCLRRRDASRFGLAVRR